MTADRAVYRAFQFGLGIFGLTALLGLANATRIFGALSQDTLLTHLHSGTLGWITMGVIGVAIWLFAGRGETLSRNVMLSGLVTAAYVLAFWSGNFPARAITGTLELLVVLYWWWWALSQARSEGFGHIDVPKLSMVLGLTILTIGAIVGVTIQLFLALGITLPTSPELIGTHASAQIGGYLVLVSAGIAEWRLSGGGSRSRAGLAQAYLLFLGGVLLAIGVGMNIQPFQGLATLFQVIGIVIIAIRFGGRALKAPWGEATGTRHVAIAVPFLVLGLILEIAFLAAIIQAQGDFTRVSLGLQHALDHTFFVGVMTNILFGMILLATAAQGTARVWPWADNVIFWGLNLGAASFIAVLLFVGSGYNSGPFQHPVAYAASVMGLSALLGIATLQRRLGVARRDVAMAAAPA
ncbi:MAG: hypothetical protein M3Z65_03145 [Chloroflexota bacterium]|nr:hypothetical protein [Chloroflexota bacterium]